MRTHDLVVLAAVVSVSAPAWGQAGFTLEQALSAPYSTNLTAAPVGGLVAWVEHSSGRNNLFVGGAASPARALTHNTADAAQDVLELTFAPDASAIAYTFGPDDDDPTPDGKPANPAHLQRNLAPEIFVQPLAGEAAAIKLGEGHGEVYTHDGHTLLFVRGGQVWSADLTAKELAPHQLVWDHGMASALTLSPDGKTLAFVSRRREQNEPSHSFIALFDMANHTLRFASPSTGVDTAPAFSPDGRTLAWLRAPFTEPRRVDSGRTSANVWSIETLDLAQATYPTGTSHSLYRATPNQPGSVLPHLATGSPRLFYAAGDRIVFYSEADGWVHLYAVNPQRPNAQATLLTPGAYEVEDASLTPDHTAMLYASNDPARDPLDADRRHIWRILLDGGRPIPVTGGTGIETRPVMTQDGTLAALVSDAHTPMHPAMIGAGGAISALDPATTPATYPGSEFVTPQQVLFDADDGTTLHGQLFLPAHAAKGPRAALIFVHGGPRRQMLLGYPGMDYYSNAYAMNQYLASRGFIVLSVNYHCGVGYGMEFRQCLKGGPAGGDEFNDVMAAANYLRARKDVDPARLGIWGGSYGGYLTAMALARDSAVFAAGVDFHGVHDWNLEDNAGSWIVGNYTQRDALSAVGLAASPLADISRWRSPVLFIHGDDDGNVAYAQTPILADKLRALNTTLPPDRQIDIHELIFPDEIHGFLLHSSWLAAYEAEAAFFAEKLHPER
jgi:dipeptidyl aminopeptidase/acylaminoacyl peptidase